MSDQLQCPGCAARFRVRLGPAAPARAELACPRCDAVMALERSTATQAEPRAAVSANPTPDRRPGWRSLNTSDIFGRPTPAPPSPSTPRARPTRSAFEPGDGPQKGPLGLFEPSGNQAGAPRLPEADRPGADRPLASALLQELRGRRKGTFAAQAATTGQPLTTSLDDSSSATDQSSQDMQIDTDDWLGDDLIDEAVDAATEELLIVDEASLQFERLPGARLDDRDDDVINSPNKPAPPEPDVDTSPEASAAPSPPKELPDAPQPKTDDPFPDATAPPAPPPPSPQAPEPPEPGVELPLTISAPESSGSTAESLSLEDAEATATTYRLRIGAKTYGDIEFDSLITLFRRGIWVVADAIAEDDGPWVPIEEHPIFERVRDVIAQSVTSLLLAHSQVLDERSDLGDATPAAADVAQIKKVEITEEADPDPDPIPTIRAASNTLPWTIALVTTGIASATVAGVTGAAIAYAYFADPSPVVADDTDSEQAVSAPAVIDEPRWIVDDEIEAQRAEAINEATRIAVDAARADGEKLAETALERGAFEAARHLASHHAAQADDPSRLQAIFEKAVSEDPHFRQQLRTITPRNSVDDLRALGGGRSITLRFTSAGDNRYAYKVAREEWEEGWRAEIAAYKLSKLLPLDLYVPFNEPARISRADFDELYGRINTPRQHSYAEERFHELHWKQERGPDGVQRDYLYGTLKEWIPEYTTWPIEYVHTWRPWLDPDEQVDLDAEPETFLTRLSDESRSAANRLEPHIEGRTKGQLARQVSNLHVFDFLTNNFDRYSGVEDYYGVNAHFAHGRFVPIDNSAAFQYHQRRELAYLDQRLEGIGRFDRTVITAIRMLRPEVVNPVLFPEPTSVEQRRLEFFWEQRQKLLDHVDEMIDEYGEDVVYAFD